MMLAMFSAGKELAARSPGTTASIKDLFKSLPVRAKAFKNNLKKEYVKLVHLLQAYATVCTGVRFIATNQVLLHILR
jgi:DNA mismatch repair protein PMS2